jgi:hypothetical protein
LDRYFKWNFLSPLYSRSLVFLFSWCQWKSQSWNALTRTFGFEWIRWLIERIPYDPHTKSTTGPSVKNVMNNYFALGTCHFLKLHR